ncbi:MAG TPA: M28 family peptidase [Gemmatimonadaceae bacterium]|nr:M28 family peptidase [Gemmatimonadaceae bacterium]
MRLPVFLFAAVAAVGCASSGAAPSPSTGTAAAPDSLRIRTDIAYLASDRLEGRRAGTPGNDSAAAYIARRYRALGLAPLASGSYLQPFVARPAVAHGKAPEVLPTQNVVAMLAGTDPALRNQWIVIGAHFDHLGRSTEGALDPQAGDAIRNGADDNASGTAAVMELARLFRQHPTRRSLLFVNFSAEEEGLLGSAYFVDHSPVPLDSIDMMLNFDMVGRLRNQRLIVYGVATASEFPALLDTANAGQVHIFGQGDGFGPSDQSSFYARDIPVLFFFTDLHEDYHKATDDIEKINAGGEATVVGIAERVIRDLGNRPQRVTFTRVASKATMAATSSDDNGVYLGSVPDMAAGDIQGERITGVTPGSPADKAGLKAGDVVVEFGGVKVTDLESYAQAMYAHKPGDVVTVVVLRDGKRRSFSVTLGRRGN